MTINFLHFCILIVFVVLLCGGVHGEEAQVGFLSLKIVGITYPSTVTVKITNTSSQPIRIWKDSNSWGAGRWRLLRTRGGVLETFVQSSKKIFTRNVPRFDEISGGSHLPKTLNLNGEDWQLPGDKKVNFQPGDTVIIIYDVPGTPETRKMNVWHGFIAALMIAR